MIYPNLKIYILSGVIFVFFPFDYLLVYLAGLGIELKIRHMVDEGSTTETHPQPKYGLSKGRAIVSVCSIGNGLMVVGGNHSPPPPTKKLKCCFQNE